MAALVYIHGFLSSPQSFKAQQVKTWLAEQHPKIHFECPHLPAYPGQAQAQLKRLIESLLPGPVYLMGSSLGGFWATWAVETYNLRAVVINPAVNPQALITRYLEVDLKGYHTDDSYRLNATHVDEIRAADLPVTRHNNYWLLVQAGDETLDYRQAVAKYQGCRQSVEEGGDHAFQGFERYFDSALAFLTQGE